SHTPDSGGPWTRINTGTGSFVIAANGVDLLHNAGTDAAYRVDTGSADHYAQATILSNYRGKTSFCPVVRFANHNNFVGTRSITAGTEVFKRVAGVFTRIANPDFIPVGGTVVYLEAVGSTFKLKFDGVQI